MTPEEVEALAAALARHLRPLVDEAVSRRLDTPKAGEFVDAAEIARRFTVKPQWVRDHADELGAVRVGQGERPRLRFDPALVEQHLKGGSLEPPRASRRQPGSRRSKAASSTVALLPVADRHTVSERGEDAPTSAARTK